jgi:hypothetical protein
MRPLVDGETNFGERRVLDGEVVLVGMKIESNIGPALCGAVVANVNGDCAEPPPPHPTKSTAAARTTRKRRNTILQ